MFLALCDGTYQEIYAIGKTKEQATKLLFEEVKEYLVARQAPETSEMDVSQLQEYFGYTIIKIESGKAGLVK